MNDSSILKFLAGFCDKTAHPCRGTEYITYLNGNWYATDGYMIVELSGDEAVYDDGLAVPHWWAKLLSAGESVVFDGEQWECGPYHFERFINVNGVCGRVMNYRTYLQCGDSIDSVRLDARRVKRFFAALGKVDGLSVALSRNSIWANGTLSVAGKDYGVIARLQGIR